MTRAETRLWDSLRQRRLLGLRFRRQHAIGRAVLDFYCPEHKLAIEVDGGVHDEADPAERDMERIRFLSEKSIRVLRVRNEEVRTALNAVLSRIAHAIRLPPANEPCTEPETTLSCSPPSLAGEGPGVGGSSADAT